MKGTIKLYLGGRKVQQRRYCDVKRLRLIQREWMEIFGAIEVRILPDDTPDLTCYRSPTYNFTPIKI